MGMPEGKVKVAHYSYKGAERVVLRRFGEGVFCRVVLQAHNSLEVV